MKRSSQSGPLGGSRAGGGKARVDETGAGNRDATGTQYWHGVQIPRRPLGSTLTTPERGGDCAVSRQADELREWWV